MRLYPVRVLLAVALLAACETAYKDGRPNERSPMFWVPVGSKLVLHRSIEIPPGQGTAYLQDGKLFPWYDVNQYAPYCALGVETSRNVAQHVRPDTFVVRRFSQRSLFTLALDAAPSMRQARLVPARRDSRQDGMTYEVLAWVMEIRSERRAAEVDPLTEVRGLTCASWSLPQGMSSMTVEQMRRALGDYFTLELAAAAARTR